MRWPWRSATRITSRARGGSADRPSEFRFPSAGCSGYVPGMIAHLRGRLEATGIDYAVIDVGGVGYLVGASAKTLAAIGPIGEAATLFTEMLVAEDFIRLVGFARPDERDWFRLLTGVQGVGARVALAILSVLEPVDLARAIAAQDKAMIGRANGVGPKLAERIVRELKDKAGGVIPGSVTPVA